MTNDKKTREQLIAELEELRTKESLFSKTFHSSPMPMAISSLKEGRFVDINDEFLRVMEYKKDEIIGKTREELDLFWDKAERDKTINAMNKTSAMRDIEITMRTNKGKKRYGIFSIEKICIGNDEYLLTVMNDITDRKQTEHKLKNSMGKNRFLAENLMVIAYQAEIESSKPYLFEGAVKQITGCDTNDFLNSTISWMDIVHPEDIAMFRAESGKLLSETDYIANAEYRILHKNGDVHWIRDIAQTFQEDGQKMVWGFVTDITEQKRLEERIVLLGDITEQVTDSIITTDMSFKITYANNGFKKMYGYSIEEILGKTPSILNASENADAIQAEIYEAVSVGKTWRGEVKNQRKDGTIFPCELTVYPLKDDTGQIFAYAGNQRDITQRKRIEEKLRESENKFRSITENAMDFIFIKDKNRRYTFVNQALQNLLGLPVDEILGKTPDEVFGDEQGKIVNAIDDRTFAGETVNVTKELEIGDKKLFFNTIQTPLSKKDGEVTSIMAIVRDVTKQFSAEAKILESENKFRAIFENAGEAMWIVDLKNASIIDSNDMANDSLGYTREEFKKLKISDIDTNETEEETKKHVAEIAKAGFANFESIYKKKNGELRDVIVTGTIITIGNKKYGLSISRDITDLKLAQKEIVESNKRFKDLAELLPGGVFETDKEFNLIYLNKFGLKLAGYSKEDMKHGLNGLDLLDPKDRERAKTNFAKRFNGVNIGITEYTALKKDGSTFPILFNADSITENGEFKGLRGIIIDNTEIKRLREMESRAGRLEMAGTIAGQVAHDFNNLLAPLVVYPGFVRDELPIDHPSKHYLDRIEEAAQKMANINQDLLTMGRRGHFDQKILNLNMIVKQAVTGIEPLPWTLTINLDLDPNIMNFRGGGAQIYRIIINLLNNAKESMQDDGHITVKTENYYVDDISIAYDRVPKGEYIKLTISDNGHGIADDIVQNIFDPFFTSKTANKKRGSGLGLSVVDAVIRDHLGFIDLSTELNEGTSFYIYFPAIRESIDNSEIDLACGGNESILVVDDDELQREVSSKLLQRLGYKVSTV
ncbi:MAG: PAS domain S-box protein, partial [candidate division Zixibacteria bacterium]|nr:PAS domain S-box protein [candidate division Zixibacteria bacterium]